MQLDGATALVTGASSGIGAALARRLAGEGTTVGLVGRRREQLDAVLADCHRHTPGSRVWVQDFDDTGAAEQVARAAWAELGPLDVVVNNAAMPRRRRIDRLAVAELQQTMRVNFEAPARICLALAPLMAQRGRGVIVNVSSTGGRHGIPAQAAYCASKFALAGFTEVLRIDLEGTGVRAVLVNPGPIDTDIWQRPDTDPAHYDGPLFPPELVADGIVDALHGDGFEYWFPDLSATLARKNEDVGAFLDGLARWAREKDAAGAGDG